MQGLPIVAYLFLGGAGGGACLVLAFMGLFVPRSRMVGEGRGSAAFAPLALDARLLSFGFGAASAILAFGMGFLLVDLGRTDRLSLLVTQPSLSYIAIGTYVLVACLMLALLLTAAWSGAFRRVPLPVVRVLHAVLAGVAFATVLYTGLFLASIRAVPLWASAWLPALFALSAASCGIGVVLLASFASGAAPSYGKLTRNLVVADMLLVALEAVATAGLLLGALSSGNAALDLLSWLSLGSESAVLGETAATTTQQAAALGAYALIAGSFAPVFWGGYVAFGLAVPLVSGAAMKLRVTRWVEILPLSATCLLIGGFIMRYCVVLAGVGTSALL